MRTMTYEEYVKLEGIRSSEVADFVTWDENQPPKREESDFLLFGKRFEEVVRMKFDTEYEETFSVMPEGPSVPADWLDIIDALRSGVPLGDLYRHTKSGALDGRQKNLHWWLDLITEGKLDFNKPLISADDEAKIQKMAENLLNCYVDFIETPVEILLKNASWSVPVTWDFNGIKKKALLDAVSILGNTMICLDLKTSGGEYAFNAMWRKAYRWQDRHYAEALLALRKNLDLDAVVYDRVVFLVSGKDEPYLSKASSLHPEDMARSTNAYNKAISRLSGWKEKGSPKRGYLPSEYKRVYDD